MRPKEGETEFQHWRRHNELYGPLSSITVMGQPIVVIHDRDAARFLLEKRSKSTSSRPHMEFGYNMCGFKNILSVQKFEDSSYVRRRRLIHQHLGTPAASERYKGLQEAQSGKLLQRALESPEQLADHIEGFSAAIVLDATYGYTLEWSDKTDPVIKLVRQTLDDMIAAFMPMAWLVDAIPAMRHLPGWLPGASFVGTAKKWKKTCEDAASLPFAFVKAQMERGTHRPSYVSNILESQAGDDDDAENDDDGGGGGGGSGGGVTKSSKQPPDEEDTKWTALTMYAAGVETTSSTLDAFVLAMVMFPDVQRRAQEEIDRVVGADRLPSFRDRADLPYTDNLVTELLRWFPVLPMGLAHLSQEDFVYGDCLIPGGAYLLPAVWWMCHDPAHYADPDTFDPDRYAAPRREPDPRGVIFGFGRRICPGRYFVSSSLFIAVARLLAAFTISKAVDAQGREVTPEIKYTVSVTTRPVKFPFKIAVRSAAHATLVQSVQTTTSSR
ncbi:cytochrome P450 oxidoreductase OrdA-like protein [Cordyceps javanica]|uniref:Cytochrome P450 oxidoreductase OrdA-like protein n=1 Tax=Cordyceps javanica TaxID=43265 RepID=A0A545VCK0_9HYPO|nr:cytochrome P450 oxidoreductase OrdA-like protein [Cordyceps javanica]TQW10867.1 cytochrome P450 oxidoreductase OrdA-like protein [Cordyceps javanica]